jgi:hypothetical protein
MTTVLKEASRSPFRDYSAYVSRLQRLARESNQAADWNAHVDAALNGQASVELRRVSTIEMRRKVGAFFTGAELGSKLIGCGTGFGATSVFYDPTCGMGDLLVAAAKELPLSRKLPDTLRQWGQQLSGTDLHREFIDGARTRLILLARQRHKSGEPLQVSDAGFFPNIRVADGLRQHALFERATHLLLNPPFGQEAAPVGCKWAGGRITEAATFVVAAIERSRPSAEILAILPDVLRSGAFSEQWRKRISQLAEVRLVEPYGIFDDSADVDVFLLSLNRRDVELPDATHQWIQPIKSNTTTIADLFNVHVGRVVPHRDPETGKKHPYIHARCVPTWTVMREFPDTRRHLGIAYEPPFVVIRRTSRPGDLYRATATVIAGTQPIAVENHLIVCEPKDSSLAACQKLMTQLKTTAVNEFLNERIRCRHLTVGAVKEIPC